MINRPAAHGNPDSPFALPMQPEAVDGLTLSATSSLQMFSRGKVASRRMSVVVLMIEHLGKVFLSTHPNHAIAWSTLLSYVNGAWAEHFPDRCIPVS